MLKQHHGIKSFPLGVAWRHLPASETSQTGRVSLGSFSPTALFGYQALHAASTSGLHTPGFLHRASRWKRVGVGVLDRVQVVCCPPWLPHTFSWRGDNRQHFHTTSSRRRQAKQYVSRASQRSVCPEFLLSGMIFGTHRKSLICPFVSVRGGSCVQGGDRPPRRVLIGLKSRHACLCHL